MVYSKIAKGQIKKYDYDDFKLIESLNWLVRQESELELRHGFLGKFSSMNYAQRQNHIANEFKLETEWIILQMFRGCNIKVTPQLPR